MVIDGLRWEVRVRGAAHGAVTGAGTGAGLGAGPGAGGRPLLLLHGFTGRGTAWAAHAAAWVRDGRRLVIVDLPGHGRTQPARGGAVTPQRISVERTADDLARILRALGAVPADVVGYSLGARVALRLAVAHPDVVASLVLESPSAGIADPGERARRREADEELAARIERDGIRAFVAGWERNPVFASHALLPAARARRQRAIRLANRPDGLALSLRGAGQGAMEPLHGRLGDVIARTLVITGDLDAIGAPRARAVAAGIPGAQLQVIHSAGHTPHDEQPATFHRHVDQFLRGATAA